MYGTITSTILNIAIWLGRKHGRTIKIYDNGNGFTMVWKKPL